MRGNEVAHNGEPYEPQRLPGPAPSDGWSPTFVVTPDEKPLVDDTWSPAERVSAVDPPRLDETPPPPPREEMTAGHPSAGGVRNLPPKVAETAQGFEEIDDALATMLRKVQGVTEEEALYLRAACVTLRLDAERRAAEVVAQAEAEAATVVKAAARAARAQLAEAESYRADASRRLDVAKAETRAAVRAHLAALELLGELNERVESLLVSADGKVLDPTIDLTDDDDDDEGIIIDLRRINRRLEAAGALPVDPADAPA